MITPRNNHREGGEEDRLCIRTRCSCDICNLNGARVELDCNKKMKRDDGHRERSNNNVWWKWKRRWWKLKGESDYINKKFLRESCCSSANSEDDGSIGLFCSLCSSSSPSSPCRVCISQEEEKSSHSVEADGSRHDFNYVRTKQASSSEETNNRWVDYLISQLLRQKTFRVSSAFSVVTLINVLVIFTLLLPLLPNAGAFPTNNCDWLGSGSSENIVQAVYLRCQQGQILWERPRGGLRVNISPPPYLYRSDESESESFRLCLESNTGTNFQVFLEQSSNDEDEEDRRKLLPFLSPESTTCYRIATSSATLYVESQSVNQQSGGDGSEDEKSPKSRDAYQVKISYEIEESKLRTGGFNDDECRPCSDEEVLQLYCVADVVAKGEIISVRPSAKRKGTDSLHIKSDLVIHQNHPVFQPLKVGNKNLQKFLAQDIPSFDQDSPKKVSKSSKSSLFGGILSHPTKCAAQSGPGEFLWLVKLSFGRPKIGCVIYWDKWTQLAKAAVKSGSANCPLVY